MCDLAGEYFDKDTLKSKGFACPAASSTERQYAQTKELVTCPPDVRCRQVIALARQCLNNDEELQRGRAKSVPPLVGGVHSGDPKSRGQKR